VVTTSSWKMRVETVFDQQNTPPYQRRPKGHVTTRVTKRGNKKRGTRERSLSLLDEDEGGEQDDEEDDQLCSDG
jgi:hypothetical protein